MREDILIWMRNGVYRCFLKGEFVSVDKLILYTMETFKVSRWDAWECFNALVGAGAIERTTKKLCIFNTSAKEKDAILEPENAVSGLITIKPYWKTEECKNHYHFNGDCLVEQQKKRQS